MGEHWSGDLSIAFATGHGDLGRGLLGSTDRLRPGPSGAQPPMVDAGTLVALYEATVDATEEAIVNALFAAETMTGRDGITAYELPIERVWELMSTAGPPS